MELAPAPGTDQELALAEPFEKYTAKTLRKEVYRLKLKVTRKGPDWNDNKQGYIELLRMQSKSQERLAAASQESRRRIQRQDYWERRLAIAKSKVIEIQGELDLPIPADPSALELLREELALYKRERRRALHALIKGDSDHGHRRKHEWYEFVFITIDVIAMRSLVTAATTCRASSVLDRNKTLYGADHMLSTDATTCWNSAQGSPQQVQIQFQRAVHVRRLDLMFQGGFVGQDVDLRVRRHEAAGEDTAWTLVSDVDIDPEDSNALQSFECGQLNNVDALRLTFKRSTDFYGRVIIYRLGVLGEEAA
ncbi:hypothetical protein P43SY_003817 [Pythium insidiosum]|uniref:F5/8 type C domain-containing protein n=1 Tax=Pythium insidiosum TaxID=114742 RepID=A0AAD5Q3F3_PYTIN|nr:hypothetical protein P43SY_003817 [Pythium insidiosum]